MDNQSPLKVQPQRVAQILFAAATVVTVFTFLGQFLTLFPEAFRINTPTEAYILDNYFILEFKLNIASNIVIYFSAFILLISVSVLFFIIALYKNAINDGFKRSWFALGAFFLYLSINKSAILPEKNTVIFTTWTDKNGWFEFRWAFIIVALAILFLLFRKFLLQFDARFRNFFLASTLLYYAGLFGTELFSGYYTSFFNPQTLGLLILTGISELAEFSGLILIIYTLLHYMETQLPEIRFLTQSTTQSKNQVKAQ